MFSQIVVGTDGSDTAAGAVALAVDLARLSGATLHVVTAYKDALTSVTVAHVGAVAIPDSALTAAELQSASEEMLMILPLRARASRVSFCRSFSSSASITSAL